MSQHEVCPIKHEDVPTTAQYPDGVILLHGTKVEFRRDGRTRQGTISNKYTEDLHKVGADIIVRTGRFDPKNRKKNTEKIKHQEITRIVERSHWHDDYVKR